MKRIILTKRFHDALLWVSYLHAQQKRKGTQIPYISHLMGVSSLVLEHSMDEDEVIAALLHDAVEDQGGEETLARIKFDFGSRVAEIVDECTDAWVEPKPEWRERKEKYIAGIPAKSPSAKLVSLADKIHNARAILFDYRQMGEELWSRFTGKKEGTLWYYRSLADTFESSFDHPLVGELKRVVSEIEELAR